MKRFLSSGMVVCAMVVAAGAWQPQPARITVDYPLDGSVFPPEFPAPLFQWRDAARDAAVWKVEVAFAGGQPAMRAQSAGEPMRVGRIDPRCQSSTNQPPKLTPEQAAAHTWRPDPALWAAIKRAASGHDAVVTISGYRTSDPEHPLSRGQVTIQTSNDPVGAPIFYRDVPLMPSETERGVIKPLAKPAIPLIAWRLRNVGETTSRLLMTGIHSCANCHSVSTDGRTMGMDLDGPRNDKGLYALFPIQPQSFIRDENVIAWSTFQGKLGGKLRVGFMSQVSPNGQYVITMINDPGAPVSEYQRRTKRPDLESNYYVANFKDYRFLQVFYPTRGILAWFSRATGRLEPLPGADDPRYVHTDAVWSPDGKYLVFARAEARDANAPGRKQAEYANDPNEVPIQYDLYRIPFNGGQGGRPERIVGASQNGMSNTFPKVSPDGRWIVFVQCRNGQLMRPDSQLYIVPASGGEARRMRANTTLMNSWHSFSPNGRWLVFSSKSRSPYTQLFLTHLDEQGNDSPAILIENATDSNRAANIPEFVNIRADGLMKIDAPVTDYYRLIDTAEDQLAARQYEAAAVNLRKAVAQHPEDAVVQNSLGVALARTGRGAEAMEHYRKVIELNPDFPDAHSNLGAVLLSAGQLNEAAAEFERALALSPQYAEAHLNLGTTLAQQGRLDQALPHLERAVSLLPDDANAHRNLGLALYMVGKVQEAIPETERAVKLSRGSDAGMLALLAQLYADAGRRPDSLRIARQALAIATRRNDRRLMQQLNEMIASQEVQRAAPK